MDDKWLSVNEIAEHLGVSKYTAHSWVTSKGMPGHKIGRFGKLKRRRIHASLRDGEAASSCDERGAKERSKGIPMARPKNNDDLALIAATYNELGSTNKEPGA